MPTQPHVLVVEDDADARALFERQLTGLGLRVTTAGSGEEGIAAAYADPPAMVIVDIMLPGMDGREVIRRLRAEERTSRCTIVVSSVLDAADVADLGADAVLPKPFRSAAVRELVKHLRPGEDG